MLSPIKKLSQKSNVYIFILSCLIFSFTCNSMVMASEKDMAQEPMEGKNIQMITPQNNEMVFAKKPVIECDILAPFVQESLYVEFDATDITALVKLEGGKIIFRPVQLVQAGIHQFTLYFNTETGEQVMEQIQFSTRHSKFFETASSTNRVSGGYTRILKKYQDAKDREMSEWEAEANLSTENLLAQGSWSYSFKANGRYYDQQRPAEEPLEDTLELVDFLFTGKYQKDESMVETSIGDVFINESRNTVNNLSRRGGKLVAEYHDAGLSGFVVRSDEIYGSDGDFGLEMDNKDHIMGISSDIDLFSQKANVKTIYATGGTELSEDSFGEWNETGGTKGDVKGVVVTTDFFDSKFATNFEYDRSNYDSDTSDNISAESDSAYFLRAEGTIDKFSYGAEYEHTGLDYQVPASFIRSDWEGYDLKSYYTLDEHAFAASYSKHNDDVDNKSIYGRTYSTQYGLGYDLNIFMSVPITFLWSRDIEENTVSIIDNYTDSYSSSISYMKDAFSLFFTPSYSKTNDKTIDNYDSSNTNLSLSGSYYKEKFSIQPSATFDRYKDYSTNVDTDTETYSLTFTFTIIDNLCINNTGSFSHTTASDDSIDQDVIFNDFQLTYAYPGRIGGIFSPKASLCTSYERNKDMIYGTETEETIVYITLSGDFEISF